MTYEFGIWCFMDGDQWCAVLDGFENLQESDAGFGPTKREAISDLLNRIGEP